jgi:transposase
VMTNTNGSPPLLPGKGTGPGRTAGDNRLFVEAVLWIARTGSPWRDLPPDSGPWNKRVPTLCQTVSGANMACGTRPACGRR